MAALIKNPDVVRKLESQKKNTAIAERAESLVIDLITRSLIAAGNIKTKGKTDEQIRKEAVLFFSGLKDKTIYWGIDHTDTLIENIERARRAENYEIATVLAATWIEHAVNQIVIIYGKRRNLQEETTVQIIRDCNIRAKTSWILQLLRAPAIKPEVLIEIGKIMDLRNEFVHYKWRTRDADEEGARDRYGPAVAEFDKVRNYLEKYISKYLYRGYSVRSRKRSVGPS